MSGPKYLYLRLYLRRWIMNDDEAKLSAKPAWERPVVVDLTQTDRGQGMCEAGSADDVCADGSAPGFACGMGSAI